MIKLRSLITENNLKGKTLISVDIQPEYENFLSFDVNKWVNMINESYDNLGDMVFLYNGADTLGMVSEDDYKMWLIDCGIGEDIINGSKFYDKGFAFFRYCMDRGIDEDDIVDFVKFLIRKGINDSREMTKELWKEYIRGQDHKWVRKELVALLENSDDMIHIPDLMEYLKRYSGVVLMGGGINECLKEVEISLKVLGKGYEVLKEYTY
jgi:hypothetical protein